MTYSHKLKEYFVYKEFDDEFGYEEKIYITRIFEDIEKLLNYINERKKFYTGNTRKIEIELIHGQGEDNEK